MYRQMRSYRMAVLNEYLIITTDYHVYIYIYLRLFAKLTNRSI